MTLFVDNHNTWQKNVVPYVNEYGTWKEVYRAWVNDNGVWKKYYGPDYLAPPTNDQYTCLLLHGDVFPFVDTSGAGQIVTNAGAVQSTTEKKFGAGSIDCTNGGVTVPINNVTAAYLNDFTIDFWAKRTNEQADLPMTLLEIENVTTQTGILIQTVGAAFDVYVNGWYLVSAVYPTDGDWHHIAITKHATSCIRVFIDGVMVLYASYLQYDTIVNRSTTIKIGGTTYVSPWIGYIDEFRYINGSCVWFDTFLPPGIDPYTDNMYVASNPERLSMLFHFDDEKTFGENAGGNCGQWDSSGFDNIADTLSGVGGLMLPGTAWQTSIKKFGTGALKCGGNVDNPGGYLFLYPFWQENNKFWNVAQLWNGDFCVDIWAYFNNPTFVNSGSAGPALGGHIADIDTTNPKFGTGALKCTTVDSYVKVPITGLRIGKNDFCIDFWAYAPDLGARDSAFFALGDYADGISFICGTGGYGPGVVINNVGYFYQFSNLGAWTHFAITRQYEFTRLFVDGIMQYEWQAPRDEFDVPIIADIAATTTHGLRIGSMNDGQYPYVGLIDEFRVVIGSAQYTADFTPPTSEYGSGNVLLHFNSVTNGGPNNPGAADDSNAKCTIINYGHDPAIQDVPGSGFMIQALGSGDTDPRALQVRMADVGLVSNVQWNKTLNTWHHIAITRSGNTFRIFTDGALHDTFTYSGMILEGSIGPIFPYQPRIITVGSNTAYYDVNLAVMRGYIDEFHVVRGAPVWTGAFSPPGAAYADPVPIPPLLPVPASTFLCHCDTAAFVDSATSAHPTVVTGVTLDITTKKWGGSANFGYNVNNKIVVSRSPDFEFGDNNFTIDFWLYINPGSVAKYLSCLDGDGAARAIKIFAYRPNPDTNFTDWYVAWGVGGGVGSDYPILTGQWHHLAFVKASQTWRMYINGVRQSQAINGPDYMQITSLRIGGPLIWVGPGDEGVDGNIDEFRVINGIAAWHKNFTPPTAPYTT